MSENLTKDSIASMVGVSLIGASIVAGFVFGASEAVANHEQDVLHSTTITLDNSPHILRLPKSYTIVCGTEPVAEWRTCVVTPTFTLKESAIEASH